MEFPFWKMQGCGNDFVVVDRADLPDGIGPVSAVQLCDRRLGIGADGILVVEPGSGASAAGISIWNADGSVATMCGNGLRCVVRRLLEDGRWGQDSGVIDSAVGPIPFRVQGDEIVVTLGRPRLLDGHPIEVAGVRGVRVDMGNPHFVVFAGDQPLPDLLEWAPDLEMASAFPDRTNVEIVRIDGPDLLRLRVWERGVGETQACGSGACAAAVVALVSGRVAGDKVRLILPGGPLGVDWTGSTADPVSLRGPARSVFRGTWRSIG